MTVKQLIEELQNLSPELEVVADDDAGGIYELTVVAANATVVRLHFSSEDEE